MGRLVLDTEISGKLAEWRRLQRKSVNILGLLKRIEYLSGTK